MIPAVLAFFENEIMKETGMCRAVYHRKMLQYFFDKGYDLTPGIFQIPSKEEGCVREQVYLSEEEDIQIREFVLRYNKTHVTKCNRTKLFMQSLVLYSAHVGSKLLEENPDNVGISTGILYALNENILDDETRARVMSKQK